MRIFLAGATGAIGKRLLPMLVEAGYTVTASHHQCLEPPCNFEPHRSRRLPTAQAKVHNPGRLRFSSWGLRKCFLFHIQSGLNQILRPSQVAPIIFIGSKRKNSLPTSR